MQNKRTLLLVSSLLMLPITYPWIQFTTSTFGAKWGYITGLAGYWVYCLVMIVLVSGGNVETIKTLWSTQKSGNYVKWISLLALMLVLGLFFVSFLPYIAKLSLSTGVLLVSVVALNGSIEELLSLCLWIMVFRQSPSHD